MLARQALRATHSALQQQPACRAATRYQLRSYSVTREENKVAKFPGKKQGDGKYLVSLIEGDGIGPEISQSVKDIFAAADAPIVLLPMPVVR